MGDEKISFSKMNTQWTTRHYTMQHISRFVLFGEDRKTKFFYMNLEKIY